MLCNGRVTFYSLPELSPIFEDKTVPNVGWIGGVDLNESEDRHLADDPTVTTTILLSLRRKLRPVKIGQGISGLRLVDFAGSTVSVRRNSFACVADARFYAMLDVERHFKIPLFPISSLDDSQPGNVGGRAEDISGDFGGIERSASTAHRRNASLAETPGHSRASSLGNLIGGNSSQRAPSHGRQNVRDSTPDRLRGASPASVASPLRQTQIASPRRDASPDKPLPPAPEESTSEQLEQPPQPPAPEPVFLKPHIVSPSPEEFLLVTGTGPTDPGVGIFVNLEGDVTRSTLEFERYPDALVADGRGVGIDVTQNNAKDDEEGYILASMSRHVEDKVDSGLEIQRWDLDPSEAATSKSWLSVPSVSFMPEGAVAQGPGIRSLLDAGNIKFSQVIDRLRLRRYNLEDSSEHVTSATEDPRDEEELQFAQRLGDSRSRLAVWSGNRIWWVVRNPMTLQLDARLEAAALSNVEEAESQTADRQSIMEVINSLRGREPRTETEFTALGYIRQRAGVMLLMELLRSEVPPLDSEDRIAAEALLDGQLDPRVVLSLMPNLRSEIIEGKNGIWVHGGIVHLLEDSEKRRSHDQEQQTVGAEYILHFFRIFLSASRKKKGLASIANESEVFQSVDAALLVVLLELDSSTPAGPERKGSIRSELNHLVDNGVDGFERAIAILESYNRLFVLSRLYQSRKMAREVLATWKRILEGEHDAGGELQDGEQVVRNYLTRLSNQSLVEEYGVWLAGRNVHLGIQIFADEKTRVKFEPTEVVALLRVGAPAAVKEYLEYLVFVKHHTNYVNELISYYLDIVIDRLSSSQDARSLLAGSYATYRAMSSPKPTYRQFITDNSPPASEWWDARLRLLQLLGGAHSATDYDVASILARIAPFTQELVPEVIILHGRQSEHREALKLLTHNLGDYDTAVNYCLLGGSSIYHPISGSTDRDRLPSRDEQAVLFGYLLAELLTLEDVGDRVEQTGSLLERFGGWFDVQYVLSIIPDEWSVDLLGGFLVSAMRRLVRERSETMIVKSLSMADNTRTSGLFVEEVEKIGPSIETASS